MKEVQFEYFSPSFAYRNETKELQQKLMSYGMKKCEAEGLYTQAQEQAAK